MAGNYEERNRSRRKQRPQPGVSLHALFAGAFIRIDALAACLLSRISQSFGLLICRGFCSRRLICRTSAISGFLWLFSLSINQSINQCFYFTNKPITQRQTDRQRKLLERIKIKLKLKNNIASSSSWSSSSPTSFYYFMPFCLVSNGIKSLQGKFFLTTRR